MAPLLPPHPAPRWGWGWLAGHRGHPNLDLICNPSSGPPHPTPTGVSCYPDMLPDLLRRSPGRRHTLALPPSTPPGGRNSFLLDAFLQSVLFGRRPALLIVSWGGVHARSPRVTGRLGCCFRFSRCGVKPPPPPPLLLLRAGPVGVLALLPSGSAAKVEPDRSKVVWMDAGGVRRPYGGLIPALPTPHRSKAICLVYHVDLRVLADGGGGVGGGRLDVRS